MTAGSLSAGDCARLAALHREALPDSAVSELGQRYADCFYRYLRASSYDRVFVLRDERGQVMSGCVLSLRPKTLRRRLLTRTPLLLYALPWFVRSRGRRAASTGPQPTNPPPAATQDIPELLLIFTAREERSRGAGAALLKQCETFLAAEGFPEYVVRTVDEPGNRAIGFYDRNGFVTCGQSTDHGRVFRVFKKKLSLAPKLDVVGLPCGSQPHDRPGNRVA